MRTNTIENIRNQFPFLTQKVSGREPIYFDSAATSQRPQSVISARGNFYQATGGQWVYKVIGDKAIRTSLTIGRQNPQQYEVTEGLQAGDQVIITGYDTFGDAEELILK